MRCASSKLRTSQTFVASRTVRGFSLVELMVAMTLSLILLGGVVTIFISSRATYETTDRLSRIQESGRFALDSMVRDLRTTGFIGCSQLAAFRTTLNNSNDVRWDFTRAVAGFDGQASTWLPTTDATFISSLTPIPSTDILAVRTPRPDSQVARVAAGMGSTSDPVTVDADLQSTFNVGDIVMVNDCNARAVFQVTAVNGNQLQHAASGSAPGNASVDLEYAYSTTNPQGGGEVIPMQTVIYYLARRTGAPTTASPSLWRRVNDNAAEELVEGIENLQLAFGQTTGANMITYRKAGDVTDWSAVVSINIALLVRSQSEYGTDRDQATYDLISPALGARVSSPNDRHMRQIFATTVSLRNQTL